MVAVVASQLDPAAGIRLDVIGIALALGAAVSQTIFVLLARDGYPEVPTEQAMTTVLLVSAFGALAVALARRRGATRSPSRWPRRTCSRSCSSPASSPPPCRRSGS